MLMTPERRHSERARIPCHIPVELTDAARAAQFEADAVDLSVGGLSLRAAQLPDLGSQLFCTFEAMPGGAQILGRGEVVWRQPIGEGEEGGEFGLRFIEVDARNQALIDEMVAERIARIAPRSQPPEPVMASLEIENVEQPVSARLVHTGPTQALFEQTLQHFAVGKAVVAHAGATLIRGHVGSVEIRMEGTSPRLLVSLELARDPADFGEFMWGEPGSDTAPDVFAQAQAGGADADDERTPAALAAADGSDLSAPAVPAVDSLQGAAHDLEHADDADEVDDADAADDAAQEEEEADQAGYDVHAGGTLAGLGEPVPAPILARKDPSAQQLPLFRREHQHRATAPELGGLHLTAAGPGEHRASHATDDVYVDEQRAQEWIARSQQPPASDADEEASLEEVHAVSLAASQRYAAHESESESTDDAEPPPDGALMRVLGVFAMLTESFHHGSQRIREWTSGLRDDASSRLGGTGRGLFGPKPRRVTASAHRGNLESKHNLRVIVIGSLAILALVVFAYALTPSDDEPIPHQDMRASHAEGPATDGADVAMDTATAMDPALDPSLEPGMEAETSESSGAAAGNKPRGAAATDASGASDTHASGRTSTPTSAKQPKASASTASKPAGGSMIYGRKQVPNARRFLLRMAEPVRTLLGTADSGGFSVVIMGNKALDKAAPIAVGHPAVEYSAILNRRDHSAELTVRFASGRSPAYRVSGQGSTLEVLIEQ